MTVTLSLVRPEIRRSLAEGLRACSDFQREDSERLAFGIAFHDFVASYWRHLRAVREETDYTAVSQLAGDAWARTPGLLASRFDEFMKLGTYFAETHVADLTILSGIEETIVWDAGFALLTCTLDRIDRLDAGDPDEAASWEGIWDGKTELGEMDHAYQIRWYTQMRFLTQPRLDRISFTIDPVRLGRPDRPIDFERGDLDEWWRVTLDELLARLETPPGNPTGNPKCHECGRRLACGRSIATARALPATEEEADEMLGEHHRMTAGGEVRWDALKEWYRDRDPRIVQGEDVGWQRPLKESFRVVGAAKDVVRWAFRSGMNGWDFVKPVGPSNRGLQDQLIVAGLGEMTLGEEQFKTRIHKELGRTARRKAAQAAEEATT